ncbi:MAG TPA: DUF2652 domain-containing protein [Acidimicrobiia bacterium]
MAATQPACLIIADISGYTSYLAGVELDHAQDILADLMNTVVKGLRPSFKLAKLEGDAAFSYALTNEVDGSMLLDTAETCYFAFRNRLLSIRQATTCECSACSLIPALNLKIVAHHGQVGTQRIAGRSELVGSDVIVIHRLLKNSISEPAYLFITDSCMAKTELEPTQLGLRRHVEEFEHVGKIGGWIEDLEAAWKSYRDRKRVYVSEGDAALAFSGFVPAPPEVVWEFISSPLLRPKWSIGISRIDQLDPSGRRRPGTLNHCMHGEDVILQEFLDWRPPGYYTSRVTMPDGLKIVSTHEVEPAEGGSLIHDRFLAPKGKKAAATFQMLREMFTAAFPAELTRLIEVVGESMTSPSPEPELPVPDESKRLATSVRA